MFVCDLQGYKGRIVGEVAQIWVLHSPVMVTDFSKTSCLSLNLGVYRRRSVWLPLKRFPPPPSPFFPSFFFWSQVNLKIKGSLLLNRTKINKYHGKKNLDHGSWDCCCARKVVTKVHLFNINLKQQYSIVMGYSKSLLLNILSNV